MDFMHDALAGGSTLRVLTVIDVFTRECLGVETGSDFSGAAVAEVLEGVGKHRAVPQRIRVDNGTEFTSKALDRGRTGTKSSSTSPTRSARRQRLHRGLQQPSPTRVPITTLVSKSGGGTRGPRAWKEDYNNNRPHGSLRQMTPARYPGRSHFILGTEQT